LTSPEARLVIRDELTTALGPLRRDDDYWHRLYEGGDATASVPYVPSPGASTAGLEHRRAGQLLPVWYLRHCLGTWQRRSTGSRADRASTNVW